MSVANPAHELVAVREAGWSGFASAERVYDELACGLEDSRVARENRM